MRPRLKYSSTRVGVVGPVDVLEVGLVDDDEHAGRHALEERVELVARVHRPGRVVGVADVDDLRARRDRGEQRVEVVAVVAQRHEHRARALLAGVDDVARERRPAGDDLVARVEQRLAQRVEAAVRARSDADLLDRDAVPRRERLVQPVGAAVRVAVQARRGLLHRGERGRERRERALVGGELDDVVEAELALDVLDRLAGLIRRQRLDRGADEMAGRLVGGHG